MPPNRFLVLCGRLFFHRISPLFSLLLILLPPLLSLSFIWIHNTRVLELEEQFENGLRKGKIAFQRKATKERFLERYSQFDPYFLDTQIESLRFLTSEKERLESFFNHPAFPHKERLKARLDFLKSDENRLRFQEEGMRTTVQMKETEEKQRHPVQMDEEDLQKTLSLLEDVPLGSYTPSPASPQILIRDFRLKKQNPSSQAQVFEVEMELLKREFIQP